MQALFLILGEEGKEDVMRNIYILFIRWACGTAIQLGEPVDRGEHEVVVWRSSASFGGDVRR